MKKKSTDPVAWNGIERRAPLIEEKERRKQEELADKDRYRGYLFWCSEGCGFVDRNHRCEQRTDITYIPSDAIKTIQKLKRRR